MERTKMDGGGLICLKMQEMQLVRGGIAATVLDDFWSYIQKAVSFIKEYKDEIINGLRKGWKNL